MIPYSCNAPIYYPPVGTITLIVLNCAALAGAASGVINPAEGWILQWGHGLHPLQWLLSLFMHSGPGRLVGNMLFLWVFGLVTEGRLGLLRFLACYLAIGVGQSALEQAVMSWYAGPSPGSLGASSAIYGLMAMACVWAPMNEVSVVWIGLVYFHPVVATFEISIGVFAALFIGFDALAITLNPGEVGSSWLHLGGALLGLAIGAALLKSGVVDGEDWDLFAVMSGNYGADAKEKREQAGPDPAKVAAKAAGKALEARRKFDAYLEIDQPDQALAVRRRMQDLGNPLDLEKAALLRLIVKLHEQKQWADSAPLMAEFLARYPDRAEAMRLKLAQICLVELERPHRALEVLKSLQGAELAESHAKLKQRIASAADREIANGALEVDDLSW